MWGGIGRLRDVALIRNRSRCIFIRVLDRFLLRLFSSILALIGCLMMVLGILTEIDKFQIIVLRIVCCIFKLI